MRRDARPRAPNRRISGEFRYRFVLIKSSISNFKYTVNFSYGPLGCLRSARLSRENYAFFRCTKFYTEHKAT